MTSPSTPDPALIAKGLTRAQRRAVAEGEHGYCDDDGLRGSERKMFYRLEEQGLFYRPIGHYSSFRPDLALTPLGEQVRAALKAIASQYQGDDHE